MFGVENMCWISAKATVEASRLVEFLILQTGMTAFGKAYYRNQGDLVPNVRLRELTHKTSINIGILSVQELFWNTLYLSAVFPYFDSLQPSLKHLEMNTCVTLWRNAHQCWENTIQLWRQSQVVLIFTKLSNHLSMFVSWTVVVWVVSLIIQVDVSV